MIRMSLHDPLNTRLRELKTNSIPLEYVGAFKTISYLEKNGCNFQEIYKMIK